MSEEQSVEEAVSELRYLLTNTEYESSLDLLRERLEEAEIERDEMARRASEFQSWGTTCREERDEALEKLDDYIQHTIEARRKLEEVREERDRLRDSDEEA